MNTPKRTSIAQMLADQQKSNPKQPVPAWLIAQNAGIPLTEAQIAERDALVKSILGGFDDGDEPAPAPRTEAYTEYAEVSPEAWAALSPSPRAALSTCTIAPTETGHKITLQVESDADLHSLTAWLLECLESLPT